MALKGHPEIVDLDRQLAESADNEERAQIRKLRKSATKHLGRKAPKDYWEDLCETEERREILTRGNCCPKLAKIQTR
jgi:hypothetical protein